MAKQDLQIEREKREDLIKNISSGIIAWYPFEKDKKVLFIGNKKDAIAEHLFQRELELTVTDDIFESWMKDDLESFDYIISVASIEYFEDIEGTLTRMKAVANANATLLLAVNNRLGIRYFCGDRDPYTQRSFDGIEDYKRAYQHAEDEFHGRCYSKKQLKECLTSAGWGTQKVYSVFSDLQHPSLLMAEGYVPNEDLTSRVFPTYNYPNAVFLEERNLYHSLLEEGFLHDMANAFLFECPANGVTSDVLQVTNLFVRGKEHATITTVRENDIVEKHAAFPEGKNHLIQIMENANKLQNRGLSVVHSTLEDGMLKMPFAKGKNGQIYLKELIRSDREKFLQALDEFRDLILQSSEIVKEDTCDGKGAILEQGFLDMIPSNSFVENGEFVFFDQEMCREHCPANVLLYHMISSLFYGDVEVSKYIKMNELLERYGLMEKLDIWQKEEWLLINKLKNTDVLWAHYDNVEGHPDVIHSNRQRMNYSVEEYDRLFVNIFKNADTRKLILFGSGRFSQKFLDIYEKEYPVYAIIDNQKEKWGTQLKGVPIYSPELLHTLEKGQFKVIICIKNYLSVMKQLDTMGVGDYSIYDPNRNYPRKISPAASGHMEKNTKSKPYNIGYVAGVFDMFHVGHVNLLRRAKEMCNYLIVGVLQDETVLRNKNKKTVISCEDRVEVLKACRYADQVEALPLDYAGIRDAYKMFQFDCQFSGDDHGDEAAWQREKEYLNSQGADIVFFHYTEKVSSTMLREQLRKDELL